MKSAFRGSHMKDKKNASRFLYWTRGRGSKIQKLWGCHVCKCSLRMWERGEVRGHKNVIHSSCPDINIRTTRRPLSMIRWISLCPGILDFVTHRILWQRFVIIVGYYDQFALSLWVCTRGVHIALLQFQLFPFQTQQYAKLTVQRTWISMTNGPNVRQWALHLRATIWYTYIQMLSERFNALK